MAAGIGPTVSLWLLPPHEPMQRTATELREPLVSRLAQGEKLSLTDAEEARVTLREVRAAIFIDAAFGARVCPAASPSAPPPSTQPPSVLPSAPPVGLPPLPLLPPPQPVAPPELQAAARVRVQLFDSFGDGWDGLQLVVSPLSGAAVKRSFTLSPGLSSTTASLSMPLGCHQLQIMHQGSESLLSTSTRDVAEASWRLLDCPTGTSSPVHLAREVAQACVTAGGNCSMLEAPMLPPLPPPPPSPDSPPSPVQPPREQPPALPAPTPPLLSPVPSVPPPPPSAAPSAPTPSPAFGAAPPHHPSLAPHSIESSPALPPTVPLASGPQTPPPRLPEPSSPTVPPSSVSLTQPPPRGPPYAPGAPPWPSLPLPPGPTPLPQPSAALTPLSRRDRDLATKTFVQQLLVGVFGGAFAVWLCWMCHDSRRQVRRAQARARRRAEHDAPINNAYVFVGSDIAAARWLEQGDRAEQPRPHSEPRQQGARALAEDAVMLSARRPSVNSSGTSSQHARASSAVPLFGWDRVALSGPPPAGAMVEASADDGTIGHRSFQVDPNRFNSPPLVMLATGNARMAMFKLQRQSFMLHSVVHAVSLKMLEDVLLEAAELHKLEPHPNLLPLRAVVTDQPWGEVGLLSELTTGSLATLLDTSPVELTWVNGLLSLATDVAKGLAHLHGLGL